MAYVSVAVAGAAATAAAGAGASSRRSWKLFFTLAVSAAMRPDMEVLACCTSLLYFDSSRFVVSAALRLMRRNQPFAPCAAWLAAADALAAAAAARALASASCAELLEERAREGTGGAPCWPFGAAPAGARGGVARLPWSGVDFEPRRLGRFKSAPTYTRRCEHGLGASGHHNHGSNHSHTATHDGVYAP